MIESSDKSVGKWISILHRQFQIYINTVMKPYEINSSEYIYLASIGSDEGVIQSYFSEALSIDPALTTRVMKSLEEKGYISRTKSMHDRRSMIVHLTDKGREIQPIIHEKLAFWTKSLMDGFSGEEYDYIYQSLIKMSDNVLKIKENLKNE